MESNSQAMQIHISQPTKQRLGHLYRTVERGGIHVKGKGQATSRATLNRDGRVLGTYFSEYIVCVSEKLDSDNQQSSVAGISVQVKMLLVMWRGV